MGYTAQKVEREDQITVCSQIMFPQLFKFSCFLSLSLSTLSPKVQRREKSRHDLVCLLFGFRVTSMLNDADNLSLDMTGW